jgi:CheY-like chemotaxis protein
MPGIDGRKTLAFIRQNPVLKKIPVVILTTSADDNDIEQCYELGASSYIQKPMGLASMVKISGQLKSYWFDAVLLPKSIGM